MKKCKQLARQLERIEQDFASSGSTFGQGQRNTFAKVQRAFLRVYGFDPTPVPPGIGGLLQDPAKNSRPSGGQSKRNGKTSMGSRDSE